jgi:hypothetical protein
MLGPDGTKFVWGKVQEIHEISNFQIVEYLSKSNNGPEERLFSTYLNNKDLHESYPTLDTALLGCLIKKYEGNSSFSSNIVFWLAEALKMLPKENK